MKEWPAFKNFIRKAACFIKVLLGSAENLYRIFNGDYTARCKAPYCLPFLLKPSTRAEASSVKGLVSPRLK